MSKTILEWLQELPVEHRDKAIANCKNQKFYPGDSIRPNLLTALRGAFIFRDSPEGDEYWFNVAESLKTNQPK